MSVAAADEKTAAGAVSFLEQLADEHTHIVLVQVLARLDGVLAVSSPGLQPLLALLTVAGRLLLRPRVAAVTANKTHGVRLLQAARQALEGARAEPCRGAALYVLLRLLHCRDAAATRFAVLPGSWELVCATLQRGSEAVLRTNALALLCAMLQASEPSAVPWNKIVDALKAVLAGAEPQQRLIAAHLLVEGALRGAGVAMLTQDVLLHALDALRRHAPADALARRLAQLVGLLAAAAPEAFAAQLPDALPCLCGVVERFLEAGGGECVAQSLELLTVVLRFSTEASVVQFARDSLCACADAVAHEVTAPCGVSWLQVAHHVLPVVQQDADLTAACGEVAWALVRLPAKVPVSPQHVALALSLLAQLRDFECAAQVAQRHSCAVRDSPFVCLEAIAAAVDSSSGGAMPKSFAPLFPTVLASFFNARRTLQSSDPTMVSLCDGVLRWAKAALPWWQPRVARVQACMLRLPDPASWLEMMQSDQYVQEDQQLMALMLGLACCAAVASCDWQPLGGVEALCALATARPDVAGTELGVLLCLAGWSECAGPLAETLARGITAAETPLEVTMPHPFLAWAFGVRSLEPLVGTLVAVLVERNELHIIAAGAASGAVAGHLVKLLARPDRSLKLLMTADAFVRSGEEAVALFAVKGIATVLQSATWHVHELEWLCGLVCLLLNSNALPVLAAAELVFGAPWCQMAQKCTSEASVVAWYNAAATVLARLPDSQSRAKCAPASVCLVALPCNNTALLVAQLQVAGLCISQWSPHLWQSCVSVASESQHTVPVSAALFVMRSLLAVARPDEGPSDEMVHELWLVLQSLMVASNSDQLRRAVAKTLEALLQRCGGDTARALLALPWSWYSVRFVVEQLRAVVPGVPLSRGAVSFLQFVAPFVPLSDPELVARLTLDCVSSADDFAVLGALLALLASGAQVDATGREAIRRAVLPKIQALGNRRDGCAEHSSVESLMSGGLLMFPHLLWDDAVPLLQQMREDRLFRIQALLTTKG